MISSGDNAPGKEMIVGVVSSMDRTLFIGCSSHQVVKIGSPLTQTEYGVFHLTIEDAEWLVSELGEQLGRFYDEDDRCSENDC